MDTFRKRIPYSKQITALLLGGAAGFAIISIGVLLAYVNLNIHMVLRPIRPFYLIGSTCLCALWSVMWELLFRGYLFRLSGKYIPVPALRIFVNTVLYAVCYSLVTGWSPLVFLNILLFGWLCTIIVNYYDNISFVIGLHLLWDWSMYILYGLPLRNVEMLSTISMTVPGTTPEGVLYSVTNGLWGALSLSLILLCVCLGIVNHRLDQMSNPIWDEYEEFGEFGFSDESEEREDG